MRRRVEVALAGWAVTVGVIGGVAVVASTGASSVQAEPLVSVCLTVNELGIFNQCIVI